MRVGRMLVAVVAWVVAAVVLAVPVVAADDRPPLQVTPTRPLDLAGLQAGETQRGELSVLNQSAAPARVRLSLPPRSLGPGLPRRVTVTVSWGGVVVWTGPVRRLADRPVLPGRIAPGEQWVLDVRATSVLPGAGAVEVLGEQATRSGDGARPAPVDPEVDAGTDLGADAADAADGVALGADALDPRGHQVPLRVQLLSYGLLVLGVLWLVVAFRHDGGTGRGRRPSAGRGR